MFNTKLTEQDREIGFVIEQIDNPKAHYLGEPQTLSAVVLNISPVERIIKIKSPWGKENYLHQWKCNLSWNPCCSGEIERGLHDFEFYCNNYFEFESMLANHDEAYVRRAVLENSFEPPLKKAQKNMLKRNLTL